MSTRSTVHFVNEKWNQHQIVYVHHDGYPEYRGAQVLDFLETVRDKTDSRLTDAGRTAARFVVYMFEKYHKDAKRRAEKSDYYEDPQTLMHTISVHITNEDPGDIEYRYVVNCGNIEDDHLPEVVVQGVGNALVTGNGENFYTEGKDLKKLIEEIEVMEIP